MSFVPPKRSPQDQFARDLDRLVTTKYLCSQMQCGEHHRRAREGSRMVHAAVCGLVNT